MTINYLELSGVGIEFDTNGTWFRALQNVNLKLDQGEFVSLIGHSGCGKSTVLNIVAGLHRATEGGVILEGKEVIDPGPDRAVVFQNHSLMPWLTVYENVELAVNQVFRKSKSRAERREWIQHNLQLVNMDPSMHEFEITISGLEHAEIVGETRHTLDGGEVRSINLRVRIDPDKLQRPSTEFDFTARATDQPSLSISHESRFVKPR